jgi:hypothetical protein
MPRASRSSTYGQLLRSCCTCTRTRYRQSSATSELTELAGALHAGGQAADGAQRHAFPSPSAQSTTPATSRTSTSTRSSTSTITVPRSPSTMLMPCAVSLQGAAFVASLDRLTLRVVTIVEEETDLVPSSPLIWSQWRGELPRGEQREAGVGEGSEALHRSTYKTTLGHTTFLIKVVYDFVKVL